MGDEELVVSRLELRGEDIYLVPEDRLVSTWVTKRGWRTLSIPQGRRGNGRRLKYARVKFRLAHGRWPEEVDHIDRNYSNDLLANLREATRYQNAQNRARPERDLPRGVYKSSRGRTYTAVGYIRGVRTHLGCFSTVEAAAQAASTFREQHYGEYRAETQSRKYVGGTRRG